MNELNEGTDDLKNNFWATYQKTSLDKISKVFSSLNKTVSERKQEIRLRDLDILSKTKEKVFDQIIEFRERLYPFLITFLTVETVILFLIVIVNSIQRFNHIFLIHDSTLQILVGATIAQVSAMIIIIIKSVYPNNFNKLLGSNPRPGKKNNDE